MYMARRKRTAKKRPMRRRKMSGIGAMKNSITTMLVNAGMATAGYAGASFVGKLIPVDNNLVKAGAKIAAGVAFGKLVKSNAGSAIGLGMAIAGVVDIAKQFAPNLISGIGEEPTLLISGIDTIGEMDELGSIDTMGEIDQLGGIETLGGIDTMA
jgi:hypothetical protein